MLTRRPSLQCWAGLHQMEPINSWATNAWAFTMWQCKQCGLRKTDRIETTEWND